MSIYKKILGDQFQLLHPMLQKRYELGVGEPFIAKGVMKNISGSPKWLYLLFLLGVKRKFLFPEQGNNIPFTIVNTSHIGSDGEEQVRWERTFYFARKKRHFNALMSRDDAHGIVKDYLGEPSLFYSELVFSVSSEGHMKIESKKQRFIAGHLEIPLPKMLQGNTFVTECYLEEKDMFYINVLITNPLIGHLFSYEGEFKVAPF